MINNFTTGLEHPAGARNRRKATVKIRRNPLRLETDYTQKLSLSIFQDMMRPRSALYYIEHLNHTADLLCDKLWVDFYIKI